MGEVQDLNAQQDRGLEKDIVIDIGRLIVRGIHKWLKDINEERRNKYNIRCERISLPYSFTKLYTWGGGLYHS